MQNPKPKMPGLPSPLMVWALVSGVVAYGLYLIHHFGLLDRLTQSDPSRISWVILALFIATNLYIGWVSWSLHRDFETARQILESGQTSDTDDLLCQLLSSLQSTQDAESTVDNSSSSVDLSRLLSGRLESGWFIADMLFKLGLIGTVIGFIYMLSAVTDIKSMDITAARQMLTDMSSGMRLALYTTLAGLSTGAVIGLQSHLLERLAIRMETSISIHFRIRQSS